MTKVKWQCSFCDKGNSEVRHMIAGRVEGVAICDECVGAAVILLVREGWVPINAGLRLEGKLPEPSGAGEPE